MSILSILMANQRSFGPILKPTISVGDHRYRDRMKMPYELRTINFMIKGTISTEFKVDSPTRE